jgi:hypothetical protein
LLDIVRRVKARGATVALRGPVLVAALVRTELQRYPVLGYCRFHDDPPLTPALARGKIRGGYVVRDANDQALAYVYCQATESEALQAKVLTSDEARRVAANIAKLPTLLRREE